MRLAGDKREFCSMCPGRMRKNEVGVCIKRWRYWGAYGAPKALLHFSRTDSLYVSESEEFVYRTRLGDIF